MREQYGFFDRLYQRLTRRMYWLRASGIICISRDTRDRFVAEFGETLRSRTTVVPHGVDARFFRAEPAGRAAETRRRYGIEGPYILYLGMIYPMKNVGRIVQAFASVRDKIQRKLVIAGKPFLHADEALDWIDRLGVGDDVVVTGFVPDADVPSLMREADLFVFPSLYEGFGIPLIEAMASDCPVLTAAAGACPEVVGDAAYVVEDPTSTEAIARGITTILADGNFREQLVARGRRRAAMYSWARAADATIRFLETTAQRGFAGYPNGLGGSARH
jgi:glycosyltransferase involved in cell wall biosynthesis